MPRTWCTTAGARRTTPCLAWREAAHYAAAVAGEGRDAQERAELHYPAGFASYGTRPGAWSGSHDHAIALHRHTRLQGLAQVLIKRTYHGRELVRWAGRRSPEDAPRELGEGDPGSPLTCSWRSPRSTDRPIARPGRADGPAPRISGWPTTTTSLAASFDVAMAQNQSLRVRDALTAA
jgi:hypothetical protein